MLLAVKSEASVSALDERSVSAVFLGQSNSIILLKDTTHSFYRFTKAKNSQWAKYPNMKMCCSDMAAI